MEMNFPSQQNITISLLENIGETSDPLQEALPGRNRLVNGILGLIILVLFPCTKRIVNPLCMRRIQSDEFP